MPFSRDPDNYPDEYKLIWRKALECGYDVRFTCESKREAASLRHRLNAYRRAYVESKREGWSRYTEFSISLEGSSLIFRDQSKKLSGVLDQLGLSKEQIAEEAVEDYDKQLDAALEGLTEDNASNDQETDESA